MKFSFKFSNLLGTVYKKGNLLFTKDGNSVISPVGNRITVFDLKNNKSNTLPVESRMNFTTVALSPNDCIMIAVDEKGDAFLISMLSKTVVHKYKFNSPISCVTFSPDGKYFAVCKGRTTHIFRTPGAHLGEFNPFILERVFHGHFDLTTCLDWTSDSKVIAVGSKDTTVKIFGVPKLKNFRMCSLGSHAEQIVAVFFDENSLDVTTLSRNGRLCLWESNLDLTDLYDPEPPEKKKLDEETEVDLSRGEEREKDLEKEEDAVDETSQKLRYSLLKKHFLLDNKHDIKIKTADYHKKSKILVIGRSNGSFLLYELPDVNLIHSLSITDSEISYLKFNNTGDWIAVGCETHGQLLVWEWQSETYVLKQQGHSSLMSTFAYSGDGQYLVTGGEDGKVKLWNCQTGFCFVTFNEHSSAVTAVRFAPNRKFFISASLDGTVRAFDMTRYRNFKTLTSTRPVQFVSLAIDSSCEFVAAGGQDVFEIYLWSLKVGRLLEILCGHEGPVVGLEFHPGVTSTELSSVSWDKTLRIWNAIETTSANEVIQLSSDGLAVAYRPDGNEVAVVSLDSQISFFEPSSGLQVGFIEGKMDIHSGRADTDLITAKKSQQGKSFTTLCYSADGKYILTGGQSKYVCIYNREEEIIVKKYEITQNRSLDGVDDFINRRKMTEFGNINLIERRDETKQDLIRLPGAKKGDMASRSFKPEIRIFHLQFSPTNQSWAAVTTEGLLIYSLDGGQLFDPYQLEESITPDSVREARLNKNYSQAVMMALRLNERSLIKEVVEGIPSKEIEMCSSMLPEVYIEKLLLYISNALETSKHFEFFILWLKSLLPKIKIPPLSVLLAIQKSLIRRQQELSKICDFSKYTIQFLLRAAEKNKQNETVENMSEDELHM
ncbi:periodic tryptophan protein 2 homolog [Cimex lectularius]|uniref:Small-subunit processome Utp12 domain-containing protein n=1 Tax=Cimex lectularius TaxID=79782 RepID=A0A8I6RWB6_CIMLE|nr:periodic tryptophan protein 2 homolog [Cimex lectularius]